MNTVAAEKRTAISIKNILYATDFSPAAIAALPYVRGIARQYGAEIHVLHVKQPASYAFVTPEMIPNMAEMEERLAEQQSEEIHKVFAGIPHEMVCGTGSLWNEMDEIVQLQCIDLIVIGSSGRTGPAKMLLGSAAAEILRRAACPVLTVGPQCAGSAKEHLNMREILYATDFSPESVAAAPYAISFAREHRSDLTLLNVIQQTRGVELVHADQYVDSAWRLLQKLVPAEAGLRSTPTCIVTKGVPAEAILKIAEARKPDLIVLGVKEVKHVMSVATHFSRATVQVVIAKAPCPVLTVRVPKSREPRVQ